MKINCHREIARINRVIHVYLQLSQNVRRVSFKEVRKQYQNLQKNNLNPSNRDKCIYNNHDANSHHNKPMYERNPAGCDGYFRNVIHVVQLHTLLAIALIKKKT